MPLKRGMAVGLLGGSFNPAHGGHRRISVQAMERLGLDEVWWLVSPQNPLKPKAGMAPLSARFRSAKRMARIARIVPTTIEAEFGTQRTIDTLRALKRRFPHMRFLWIMGADNLMQFHHWAQWREIARTVPIVVIARPSYIGKSQSAPAMGWLRRFVRRNPAGWRNWTLPAIVMLNLGLDHRSATAIRSRNPEWAADTQDKLADPSHHSRKSFH